MILIYTHTSSPFSRIFNSADYAVPFVDKTILELSIELWQSAAERIKEGLDIYFPVEWNLEGNSYSDLMQVINAHPGRIIVITPANAIPLEGRIDEDKIILAKDNPGKLMENILWHEGQSVTLSKTGGMKLDIIDESNYLDFSSSYMDSVEQGYYNAENIVTYGKPVVLGRVDENSIICGPCYIAEDSVITNSTIYPGSVILNSTVSDSEVFASVLVDTTATQVKIRESILTGAVVTQINLTSSTVPNGAKLSGRKV